MNVKKTAAALTMTFAVGFVFGMLGGRITDAQQIPIKSTDLLRADIEGMGGKEVIIQFVEVAPGAAIPKHFHPGHEASYVLEGSGVLELEGKSSVPLMPGTTFYIPPKQVHRGKNESTTPIKVVVFRIHEKGQPVTVRAD